MSKTIEFQTVGDGWWSNVAKTVTIKNMYLGNYVGFDDYDNQYYGELCVQFDKSTWNTNEDGLIYTDSRFLKELRAFLKEHGLPGNDVDYSEQGMQGADYVSFDAGDKFIRAWCAKFGENLKDFHD
jgi:hypothetical protein